MSFSLPDLPDAKAVLEWVQAYMKPYGSVKKFEIDKEAKSLELIVSLNGEDNDIMVHVKKYELVEASDKLSIIIHEVTTSREWVNKLAENKKLFRPIPVPSAFAPMVKNLL